MWPYTLSYYVVICYALSVMPSESVGWVCSNKHVVVPLAIIISYFSIEDSAIAQGCFKLTVGWVCSNEHVHGLTIIISVVDSVILFRDALH